MFNLALSGTIPIQGSEVAPYWDGLYGFLVWLSVFFFVLVVGGMIYFIFTYPYKKGVKTQYITGSHLLEAIWIGIPTLLLMVIFTWGYSVYRKMVHAPSDAYEIRVIGKQWLWTFQYDNGRTTVGDVFVPVNRPVKLIMTSEDVLHGFFVPNFRVKQDVVPGMYTSLYFTATVPGKHQVYCTEYCGTSHSGMLAKVVALDEAQWIQWNRGKDIKDVPLAGSESQQLSKAEGDNRSAGQEKDSAEGFSRSSHIAKLTLVDQGKAVHHSKGCANCHTLDDSTKIGPSFKGLYGRQVELVDGRILKADENYIRSHIETPSQFLVKGFSPVMPTFKGLINESEMGALMAFIKSLK